MTNLKTVTEAASELGRSAGEKLDEARGETAEALHTAASSVRKSGRQGATALDHLATGTAARLDATASYVEHHDPRDAFRGLRSIAHRHLGGAIAGALAAGFFAGAALARAVHSCATPPERA